MAQMAEKQSKKFTCPSCEKDRFRLYYLPCLHAICIPCIKSSPEGKCPTCSQNFDKSATFSPKFAGDFFCNSCQNTKDAEEFWFCADCTELMMCSRCCIRNHKGHNICEWGGGPEAVKQIRRQLQDLRQSAKDDLGNRAKLRELIGPVLRALGTLLKDNAVSLRRVGERLNDAYKLPDLEQTLEIVSESDSEEMQSASSDEEKLEAHLKIVHQVLELAKGNELSLSRRLRGFKCSPEAVAQLVFDQLDFGEEPATAQAAACEALASVEKAVPQMEDQKSVLNQEKAGNQKKQQQESSGQSVVFPEQAFAIGMESAPLAVVFGSHWALVLVWAQKAEIWNIRDRPPVKIGTIAAPSSSQVFTAAALSDVGLYLLVSGPKWSVLVANLNTGVLVKNGQLDLSAGTNMSSCIGVAQVNSTAFVSLTTENGPKFLWVIGTDANPRQAVAPSSCFTNIAALHLKAQSYVLACLEQNDLKISLYLVKKLEIQLLNSFILKESPAPIQLFWLLEDPHKKMLIRQGTKLHFWTLNSSSWKTESWTSFKVQIKQTGSLGHMAGKLIGAKPEDDQLRVAFFRQNKNMEFVPS